MSIVVIGSLTGLLYTVQHQIVGVMTVFGYSVCRECQKVAFNLTEFSKQTSSGRIMIPRSGFNPDRGFDRIQFEDILKTLRSGQSQELAVDVNPSIQFKA